MVPPNLLNQVVTVRRRNSTGRDSLNNPVYGTPTSGSGWYTVIPSLQVRFAFAMKEVRFSPDGQRIQPTGTVYYNPPSTATILPEDRLITSDGIEYNVIGVATAYLFGSVVDHYEIRVQLP